MTVMTQRSTRCLSIVFQMSNKKRRVYEKRQKQKTGRRMTAVLMIMMLTLSAGLFVSCGQKDEGITSLEQLKEPGIRIGVATDTTEFRIVEEEFPIDCVIE